MFYHGMHLAAKMKNYIDIYLFKTTIFAVMPLFLSFFDAFSAQRMWEDSYGVAFGLYVTTIPIGTYQSFD